MMVTRVVEGAMDTLLVEDVRDSCTENALSSSASSFTVRGISTVSSVTDEFMEGRM